jgi:hypothetical protein
MNLRTIPRAAFKGYLRVARIPIDAAIRVLPGNREARRLSADRADATARSVAGTMFGDAELREDAQRRRTVADERSRAKKLRAEAQRRDQQGEAVAEEHREQAQRRRREAGERAQARRQNATRAKQEKTRRAQEGERKRTQTVRKAQARAEEQIEQRADEARLSAVDRQAEAAQERQEALVEGDEAQRLAEAAGRVKAERKDDSDSGSSGAAG